MTDEMIHIAKAAADLTDKVAAARAARIADLERELMTNPYIPARREAEREYIRLTEPKCQRCGGLGRVFDCVEWPRCECPEGTTKPGCYGQAKRCPECAGAAQ